jgi:phage repressor protein C with HTH and peptisase S24 domain
MIVTNTESPVVVVLRYDKFCEIKELKNCVYSGSMEPSYFRGDILFLARREKIVPGDIIVY